MGVVECERVQWVKHVAPAALTIAELFALPHVTQLLNTHCHGVPNLQAFYGNSTAALPNSCVLGSLLDPYNCVAQSSELKDKKPLNVKVYNQQTIVLRIARQ